MYYKARVWDIGKGCRRFRGLGLFLIRKLFHKRVWQQIFLERLSEPLHLNLISIFVALFGTLRMKIFYDLCVRQQHAFGLLAAADAASRAGCKRVTAIEFGVASGAGLLNICKLASRITKATGIEFDIVGFDNVSGMPPLRDYRDHPELYQPGWYPMTSPDALRAALPPNAKLLLGDIAQTVDGFMAGHDTSSPIGFVSVDVDYYWSTLECLRCLRSTPEHYLPTVTMYFDDVGSPEHNPWCGELRAIDEFNHQDEMRKIAPINFLRERRLFRNAAWIAKMYFCHIFDHPNRFEVLRNYGHVALGNPYLNIPTQER
jgi:hypothetical protein